MCLACFINIQGRHGTNQLFSEKRPIDVWEEGALFCDVSLTPKKYRFLQLIICCWFELGMSSLNAIEL